MIETAQGIAVQAEISEPVVDILMWVGDEYSVKDLIEEYKSGGISKRIPLTSIPYGIVPGKSRLFVASHKAILEVTAEDRTLYDLLDALFDEGVFSGQALEALDAPGLHARFWIDQGQPLQPDSFVPDAMLALVMGMDSLPPHIRRRLEKAFGIVYHPGVVGYGYIDMIAYVCKPGEDELPDDISHMAGYVTPVRMNYTYDGEVDEPG